MGASCWTAIPQAGRPEARLPLLAEGFPELPGSAPPG